MAANKEKLAKQQNKDDIISISSDNNSNNQSDTITKSNKSKLKLQRKNVKKIIQKKDLDKDQEQNVINHQQRILDLLSTTNRKRSQNGQIPRNNKITKE